MGKRTPELGRLWSEIQEALTRHIRSFCCVQPFQDSLPQTLMHLFGEETAHPWAASRLLRRLPSASFMPGREEPDGDEKGPAGRLLLSRMARIDIAPLGIPWWCSG